MDPFQKRLRDEVIISDIAGVSARRLRRPKPRPRLWQGLRLWLRPGQGSLDPEQRSFD